MFNRRLNKGDLVLLVYLLYAAVQILGATQFSLLSDWHYVSSFITYFTAASLLMLLYNRKTNVFWFFISAVLIIVGIIVSRSNARFYYTIIATLFIINGVYIKDEDTKKVLLSYTRMASFLVILTIMLTIMGVFYSDYRIGSSGELRQYLGFMSATHSANYFFHIVLAYVAQKQKSINIIETCIILIINYWLFVQTNTHAVYYYIIALVVLLWIIKKIPKLIEIRFATFVMALIMPVGAVLSLWLAVHYNSSNVIMYNLNKLLAERLRMSHAAYQLYGFSLFGTNVEWHTGRYGIERFTDYLFVDAAYVSIAMTYGLIFLVIIIIGFTLMIVKSQIQKKYFLSVALLFLSVHSFSDPQLFDLKYNPFILFLFGSALFFYKNRRVKRIKIHYRVRP